MQKQRLGCAVPVTSCPQGQHVGPLCAHRLFHWPFPICPPVLHPPWGGTQPLAWGLPGGNNHSAEAGSCVTGQRYGFLFHQAAQRG